MIGFTDLTVTLSEAQGSCTGWLRSFGYAQDDKMGVDDMAGVDDMMGVGDKWGSGHKLGVEGRVT
jgi:hypothetical protein